MRILSVDLGLARTGLAVCDAAEWLASPVGTVACADREQLCAQVARCAAEKGAEQIVVGLPRNMDGSCGESARRAAAFARELERQTGLPVVLWDERLTTKAAAGFLNQTDTRGKKRRQVIDTVSAVLILENYLAWRAAHPGAAAPQPEIPEEDV